MECINEEKLTQEEFEQASICSFWDDKRKSCNFLYESTVKNMIQSKGLWGKNYDQLDTEQKLILYDLRRKESVPSGVFFIQPDARMFCLVHGKDTMCNRWRSGYFNEKNQFGGVPIKLDINPSVDGKFSVIRIPHDAYIALHDSATGSDYFRWIYWNIIRPIENIRK